MSLRHLLPTFFGFIVSLVGLTFPVPGCFAADDITSAGAYTLDKHAGGIRILRDGKLVTDYVTRSQNKPILWPINGPGGVPMTRAYPMVADSQGEKHDHPHHRSFWFTHGGVNGVDFWSENGNYGIIEHQEFTTLSEGKTAVLSARNLWKTQAEKPILAERRRFEFSSHGDAQVIDCEFQLSADFGDVNFTDTKEGSFGLRIADSMNVDASPGGKILNSNGDTNKDAWGKRGKWVDYSGPIGEQTMGIAILCHPSTYNYPNRWHVRDYGLFAANPFGVHHFQGQDKATGGVDLPAGESLTFRYRVILHRGALQASQLKDLHQDYAAIEFTNIQ